MRGERAQGILSASSLSSEVEAYENALKNNKKAQDALKKEEKKIKKDFMQKLGMGL